MQAVRAYTDISTSRKFISSPNFYGNRPKTCAQVAAISSGTDPMGQTTLLILSKQSPELDKHLAGLSKEAKVLAISQDDANISGECKPKCLRLIRGVHQQAYSSLAWPCSLV